jgi:cyclopropane fatty-acyl-phospholipid synthase-like methyltransferase
MQAKIVGFVVSILAKLHLIEKKTLWDIQYRLGLWDYLDQGRAQDIIELLDEVLNEESRVVEFGCGLGTLSRHFNGKYRFWTGFDISTEAIEIANRLKDENSNFIQEDIRNWRVEAYLDVDVVVLEEVIYYLSEVDIDNLINKSKRAISKKSGSVLVTFHDSDKHSEIIEYIEDKHNFLLVSSTAQRVLYEFRGAS